MLYEINNKYYVRISPLIYTEVTVTLKNDIGVITTTQNQFEANGTTDIKQTTLQEIVSKLKEQEVTQNETSNVTKTMYIKRSKR